MAASNSGTQYSLCALFLLVLALVIFQIYHAAVLLPHSIEDGLRQHAQQQAHRSAGGAEGTLRVCTANETLGRCDVRECVKPVCSANEIARKAVNATCRDLAQLKSPAPTEAEYFGFDVAVWQNVMVVGAIFKTVDTGGDEGAAYVYRRASPRAEWRLEQMLASPSPGTGEWYGAAVAIHGNVLAVSEAAENSLGADPSVNDGEQVGAVHVYVYDAQSEQWQYLQALKEVTPRTYAFFGFQLAVTENEIVAGSSDCGTQSEGALTVFRRDEESGLYEFQQYIQSDREPQVEASFGQSLAISADGQTMAVGGRGTYDEFAPDKGLLYVYRKNDFSEWQLVQSFVPEEADANQYAADVVAIDGDHLVLGEWLAEVDAPDFIRFDAGAVRIYRYDGAAAEWQFLQRIENPAPEIDAHFGFAMAISGDLLAVGAHQATANGHYVNSDERNPIRDAGIVYTFRLSSETGFFESEDVVMADNAGTGDRFGTQVAAEGKSLYITGRDASRSVDEVYDESVPRAGTLHVYTCDAQNVLRERSVVDFSCPLVADFDKDFTVCFDAINKDEQTLELLSGFSDDPRCKAGVCYYEQSNLLQSG
jgi:hypothetical protein